jgi:hypothetical protein
MNDTERWLRDQMRYECERRDRMIERLKQALKDLAGCDDEQVELIAQTDPAHLDWGQRC